MRIIHSGSDIFLPQFVSGLAVLSIGACGLDSGVLVTYPPVSIFYVRCVTVLSVIAVLTFKVKEEVVDVGRAGVIYQFFLNSLDPQLIGGQTILTVLSRHSLNTLLTTRSDRHSHLKRIAGSER